ncbi:hypothetical protein [Streptomyces antarcticus]|uniref:hypothetical protein n=1 Tax=Streptomyces antarcticus TaxID=2996458 RepID=UPI00226FE9A3|nr:MULTISPECIES: hypothetical protein [unclassified Streptomyces]MCY0944087.1 hypothetical protein [Streptomyces sp. H34-AA3]MCY0951541.1 hypothetical protein [Streptomyces sp. H27-S2]MCZ4082195.1 hypothetical protein [Streptomyces sp. H34-S5]
MTRRHPELSKSEEPALTALEITETECRRCGTRIAGINGRYACPSCGWVNDHSEGHSPLPSAGDDPDAPGRRKRSASK